MIAALLGAALTLVGAVLLYAAAPNQLLRPGRDRRGGLLPTGAALLLAGLPLLLLYAGPATAVFIWLTLAMAVWSIVPIVVAWRRGARKAAS